MPPKDRRRAPLANASDASSQAAPTAHPTLYRVGLAASIKPGKSMKFLLPIRGVDEECFVINYRGHLHAYVNQCRHIPMAMDWVDNQFFAEHGRYLMCPTHSAYYEPDSGECIAGTEQCLRQISLSGPANHQTRRDLRDSARLRI